MLETEKARGATRAGADGFNQVRLAPEEQPDGREESGLVVSARDLETVRDQRQPLETSVADSVNSTAPPIIRALAQLSGTLLMLVGAGEVGHARVVHDAIGKLLTPLEGCVPQSPGPTWLRSALRAPATGTRAEANALLGRRGSARTTT